MAKLLWRVNSALGYFVGRVRKGRELGKDGKERWKGVKGGKGGFRRPQFHWRSKVHRQEEFRGCLLQGEATRE
jgi:hypothetical protein